MILNWIKFLESKSETLSEDEISDIKDIFLEFFEDNFIHKSDTFTPADFRNHNAPNLYSFSDEEYIPVDGVDKLVKGNYIVIFTNRYRVNLSDFNFYLKQCVNRISLMGYITKLHTRPNNTGVYLINVIEIYK